MPPTNAEPRIRDPEDPPVPPVTASEIQLSPAGNATALEEVYRLEAPRLARYFRARLRQGDEAADLVQEAFARLAGFMARKALPRPGAYLQRIARNLLYDRSKRLEVRLAAFHLPIGEGTEPAVDADQSHGIEAEDVMRIYRRTLAELPERTREIFLLHRVEELTYREIGMKLAISVPTVQYHVARALAYIDAALERG
ncbi:RNA polymerase sigma factor [Novosphingobium sp. G106]|uniref:RNA polymerase sigma factor n=1 Tax=Novosphingobium sp. G106 TaxID=2849500 RepID=UPI001C2CDC4B|nr:RNA polymerase sigma factor [Novosphingobium sp. G106]MBV1686412.1 RNA polymerase sigma factor [Novosphingobium sp. G106]